MEKTHGSSLDDLVLPLQTGGVPFPLFQGAKVPHAPSVPPSSSHGVRLHGVPPFHFRRKAPQKPEVAKTLPAIQCDFCISFNQSFGGSLLDPGPSTVFQLSDIYSASELLFSLEDFQWPHSDGPTSGSAVLVCRLLPRLVQRAVASQLLKGAYFGALKLALEAPRRGCGNGVAVCWETGGQRGRGLAWAGELRVEWILEDLQMGRRIYVSHQQV